MVIAAARVMVLRIAPIGWLDRIGPQTNRRRVVIEPVAHDRIVLTVFDRHTGAIAPEIVAANLGLVAISGPHAVLTPPRAIRDDPVSAERRLDAIRGRIADVVAVEEIVVRAARPGVHRRLARPEKNPAPAMRHGIVGDEVARALLEQQQIGRVLAAGVVAMAVAADVVVEPVVDDRVVRGPVQAYA